MEAHLRLHPGEHRSGVVPDVAFVERRRAGEVLPAAGREVVEHVNVVAALEQSVDEIRADEAGAAGDEDSHGSYHTDSSMFVTLEGLDGSGKTTQARLLAAALEADGVEVVLTREPGGTPLGEAVRDLVLHGDHVAPWAEAALYAASRAQHVAQVIRPVLERGATVVCDRYVDSSVVYQGVARGLGLERVLELNLTVVAGLMPDVTVLLRLDAEAAVRRLGGQLDRIEREGVAFYERCAEAYDELVRRFPDRFVVVDGDRSVEEIAEEIRGRVRGRS